MKITALNVSDITYKGSLLVMDLRRSSCLCVMAAGPSTSKDAESDTESSSTIVPTARHILTPFGSHLTSHQAEQPLQMISFEQAEDPEVKATPDFNCGDVIILDDPLDSPTSKIDEGFLRRMCERHEIPFVDVLVPSQQQQAHLPLVGYCNDPEFLLIKI